jgi:dihydroxy-acid dehydratase
VIKIDLTERKLDAHLSEAVINQRLAALPPFRSKATSKWLKRYSYFVTSADTGAVLSSEF